MGNSEWAVMSTAVESDFEEVLSGIPADGGLLSRLASDNYSFPESDLDGTEALVEAGILLGTMNARNTGNKQVAERRRFAICIAAGALLVGGLVAVAVQDHMGLKKGLLQGLLYR